MLPHELIHVSRFCTTVFIACSLVTPTWANNEEDPFAPDPETPREPSTSGPELGLRLGVTSATGMLETDNPLSARVTAMLPLWVDAGYRLFDRWFVGAYWQYGLGLPSSTSNSECPGCVHSAIKYGLQINYTFFSTADLRTWVGLGTGYQSFESVNETTKRGTAYTGWEPFSVHLGSYWRPTAGVEFGPFFTFSYGTFSARKDLCYEANRMRCPPENERDVEGGSPLLGSTFGIRAVFLP